MFLPPQARLPKTPFTSQHAADLGITRRQLGEMVRNGEVRRVLQGVYQLSREPDNLVNRAKAAHLVMQPFGIICDRTAAWVHGVDTFDVRELEILPPLECFVLRDMARVRRLGCLGGERDLAPNDVNLVHGVPVTTPLRTALDLGCRLGRRDALAAIDGFMRQHTISRARLKAELSRYRGRRGVVQLRVVVGLGDPRSESPSESWTRMAIVDAGLPLPELQYWVCERGRAVFRLDLAYPRHRVAVEYDGLDYHSSHEQRAADAKRREWLRERGWTIIVVTKDSFQGDGLDSWLRELRTALRLG
ncbi:MAG: type IV toxin-antitoxin system AbiEi family antitoxin domain-containing protein [Nocardioidaceae bacterium]